MSYILKNKDEFDRLENQSKLPNYDYKKELKSFFSIKSEKILDAACGSGVVSRYLAGKFSKSHITGCDIDNENLEKAKLRASKFENLNFEHQDITNLRYRDHTFDRIICRYSIQHIEKGKRQKVLDEFYRCLKPGGAVTIIDFDGTLHNLSPREGFLDKALSKIEKDAIIDLRIGRKIPRMLANSFFQDIVHEVECLSFTGNGLIEEINQLKQRFSHANSFFTQTFGSQKKANQFFKFFLETLEKPGATYFYNKFIVTGKKPVSLKLTN